jgi:hypothetical protein
MQKKRFVGSIRLPSYAIPLTVLIRNEPCAALTLSNAVMAAAVIRVITVTPKPAEPEPNR